MTLLNQKKAWLSYEEEITRKKEIDEDCKLAQKAFDEKRRKIDQVTRELKNLEDSIKDFQQKAADCVSIFRVNTFIVNIYNFE